MYFTAAGNDDIMLAIDLGIEHTKMIVNLVEMNAFMIELQNRSDKTHRPVDRYAQAVSHRPLCALIQTLVRRVGLGQPSCGTKVVSTNSHKSIRTKNLPKAQDSDGITVVLTAPSTSTIHLLRPMTWMEAAQLLVKTMALQTVNGVVVMISVTRIKCRILLSFINNYPPWWK